VGDADTLVEPVEAYRDDRGRWLSEEEYVDWCLEQEAARSRRLAEQVSAENE
jgi:hypothetical protein